MTDDKKDLKPPAKKPVQLDLQIPERMRPVSNVAVRAALFAAIQGEDRKLLDKVVIASQEGIEIIFTGRQLNQDDHDVFMQLVYMANHKPLGENATVPANAILAGLGRGNGKSQHDQLKDEMHRLVTGTVNIKCNGINFIGHLIDYAAQDERLPSNKRHWSYQLNTKMVELFGKTQFTLIDWEQRKKIKQKDLARWLQVYFASHSAPFPVSVEFLRDKSGSQTKELWKFRENLKKALNVLQEIGFLTAWNIDKSDLVRVERVPKSPPTQPQEQTRVAHHSVTEKYLRPDTVEKFRVLYPRFDPYACKGDFDAWQGKAAPRDYDTAFLGFAKKWIIGKF